MSAVTVLLRGVVFAVLVYVGCHNPAVAVMAALWAVYWVAHIVSLVRGKRGRVQ